ncbi:hypothetical protein B0F90DRAFT_937398 [Multifurca ochricompacta]|uniref:Uncharacterized protein n=1 Tax=Multifurca ochricompacta TaxID=376703 RepID=A0AAD4M8S1_9AGAM|nr:hypothetical protein B0F90DRAFT_937398 [Multifurca ochricompacta]
MEYHPFGLSQASLPSYGRLSAMLYCGYLGRTFGPFSTKRLICHKLLGFVEDEEDLIVNQELLRPEYSYTGLPGTYSVPHNLYLHLRCNSIAADGSCRIILDCDTVGSEARVVPQNLFAPYAGLSRSQVERKIPPSFHLFFLSEWTIQLDCRLKSQS